MAKNKVNLSAAVREYLVGSPEAGPKEVIEALGKKNIVVTPGLVSNVKTNLAKKEASGTATATKTRKPRGPNKASAPKAVNGSVTLADAQRVKALAVELGGLSALRDVLSAIESFSS